MKKIVCIVIIAIIMCCVVVCINLLTSESDITVDSEEICRVSFYPSSGAGSETYLYTFYENGTFVQQFGTTRGNDITNYRFITNRKTYPYNEGKRVLTLDEIKEISNMVENIFKSGIFSQNELIADSWKIQIYYQGETLIREVFDVPPEIQQLVDKLKSISPIDLDLRGFA